jgi:hypothetical protein
MGALTSGLRHALDPVAFAVEVLDFRPDPWQADVLRSKVPRLALNCCRQSGKSTTVAVLATHRAVFAPGSLILVVSPSIRQSGEWFKKVTAFVNRLPEAPELVEDNKLSLQMTNGSRVVSLPSTEATLRGFSAASLVVEDEASRVLDETHQAIRAMTAVSRGQHIQLSTPNGRRGHFFDAVEGVDSDWQRVRVTWRDCPRIDPAFVEAERRSLPPFVFAAEWDCEFSDTEDMVFMSRDVAAMFDDPDVQPLFPERLASYSGGNRVHLVS